MNSDLMGDYVRHIADVLLMSLGFPVLYGKPNPVRAVSQSLMPTELTPPLIVPLHGVDRRLHEDEFL